MENCFIEQNGKVINCGSKTHEQTCRTLFKTSLDKHLKNRYSVRIKIHGEEAAIESYDTLSDVQRAKINSVLCKCEVFVLVTFIRGVYKTKTTQMRPIRSL